VSLGSGSAVNRDKIRNSFATRNNINK
jgi:hypothetical protein